MLYIHGAGHFHPENVIDNAFLTSLDIDTSDEWIVDRVGIRERRTLLPLSYIRDTYNQNLAVVDQYVELSNAATAAKAAHMALERANITKDKIGMVIAGGSFPQHTAPAQACAIAAELGLEVPSFDLNSGCATFAAQLHFLNMMREDALPDYVLLVIPDNTTRSVDFKDRRTAVLWGDCSIAVVLSTKIKSSFRISHSTMTSDPSGWNKVMIPVHGHVYQEGQAVQKFAISKSLETISHLRNISQVPPDQHYFIGHQANLTMLKSVCKKADIADEKHLFNVDYFGNCAAAGAPSVLSQNWERFVAGDNIVLVVVGTGLTWAGVVIQKV